MKPESGVVIFDRFRLERLLGRGGMGSVWLARHLTLNVDCAVKFIEEDAGANPQARSRFEREAQAAARIKSPNVVGILDYGVFEGTPYIAMEYLEGEDLARRLERVGALGRAETYTVVEQVGRALTKAHAAGIVHRDLKPENIFVTQDEDGITVKVLDFGVAKHTSSPGIAPKTRSGVVLGTPFYMSPEQARGQELDARSDLWALGVIVYRCLTGRLPFSGDALGDLFAKIIYEDAPPPSTTADGLPAGLDAWWKRAAARAPEDRFQSARELTEALATALELDGGGSTGVQASANSSAGESTATSTATSAAYAPTLAHTTGPVARTATADPVSRTFGGQRVRPRRAWLLAAGAVALIGVAVVVGAKLVRHSTPALPESAAMTSPGTAPAAPGSAAAPGSVAAPGSAAETGSAAATGSAESNSLPDAAAPGARVERPKATPRRPAAKPGHAAPAASEPKPKRDASNPWGI